MSSNQREREEYRKRLEEERNQIAVTMDGAEMRRIRRRLGLTQVELGRLIACSQPKQKVSEWERGKRPITRRAEMTTRFLKSLDDRAGDTEGNPEDAEFASGLLRNLKRVASVENAIASYESCYDTLE